MEIGKAIKELRKNSGMSQKELASLAGISVNSLSLIETNESFPQKTTIKAICDALKIPVSYLLFFSISEEDVPADRRGVFNSINNAVKSLLLSE